MMIECGKGAVRDTLTVFAAFFRFFRRKKHKKCQEKTHCRLLRQIIKGYGNNGKDRTEGVRYKNAFCTYSHGPVLPKNPAFADTLIKTALKRKYGTCSLDPLQDNFERLAHDTVLKQI